MASAIAHPLVSAAELQAALGSPSPPLVFDVGFDLADPAAGRRSFDAAHLPGAQYLHLEDDLSAPKNGRNGRHPLPDRATFAATVGARGVQPSARVVVYDRHGGMYAARAWWMLRWIGHADVAVLDGGWAAWTAVGGAVDTGPAAAIAPAAPYPLGAENVTADGIGGTLDADALARRLGAVALIDARAPERFRGDVEPLDARAGHIPGARNRFFKDNLGADGRFKPAEQLGREFDALLGDRASAQVVHQCGSGVTACHNLLAMELAGRPGALLYPGSWSEWSSDPSRPVAIG